MFLIEDINITPEMLKAISEIDEFKGKWQATLDLAPDRLNVLKRIATIESVGSSTRIEGAKLSDEQVGKLLSKLEQTSFSTRDEQEVAGYADGKSIGVVFQTATPFETPTMMKELVGWYNEQENERTQHPLFLIAVFTAVFLVIHPFKDGNGRLSRILTTLLLLRVGYSYVPYSSMETIIEANKENYYLALRRTQQTIRSDDQNWEPWVVFFLKTMVKQKENLSRKVHEERSLKAALPALSRSILELVQTRGEITVREIEEFTSTNRNTIKAHLKRLTEQEYLISVGKGRGARYMQKKQG